MQKKFVRGLKQHGKNFFKIRRDLLYNKETVSWCFTIHHVILCFLNLRQILISVI